MKFFKKLMATVTLTATLFLSAPTPKANAGIILLPAGIGAVLIIIGAIQNNAALIILDEDGGLQKDELTQYLSEKYPQIDEESTLESLAQAIKAKIPEVVDGQEVKVQLSADELEKILEPSGLIYTNPELVEQLVEDFS